MKIALIGATGFVGSAVLKELLARGHAVLALARHPAKLAAQDDKLSVVSADVQDAGQVSAALQDQGVDALVSAYNPGWSDPAIYDNFLKGSQAILAGVKAAGLKRLLVVGGAGSLYAAPGVQIVDTPDFPAPWKAGASAARDALKQIETETSLDWTFVSPPLHLEPGERLGPYRLGRDTPVFDAEGHSRISVADLAVAIVDELEKPAHVRQRFTVAY